MKYARSFTKCQLENVIVMYIAVRVMEPAHEKVQGWVF
jgi:hypothetical protein